MPSKRNISHDLHTINLPFHFCSLIYFLPFLHRNISYSNFAQILYTDSESSFFSLFLSFYLQNWKAGTHIAIFEENFRIISGQNVLVSKNGMNAKFPMLVLHEENILYHFFLSDLLLEKIVPFFGFGPSNIISVFRRIHEERKR